MYRSTNRGVSFTFFPTPDIAFGQDATNDPYGRISLAYGTAPGQEQTLWALVSDAGRFNGHSAAELPDAPDPLALGVDPFKDSELGGLYRSTDDGATWSLQATSKSLLLSVNSTQAPLEALDYGPGVQASYNNWVATDPIDPNRVYFGLEEAFEGEYGAANPTNVPVPVNADYLTKFQVIQRYADICGFYSAIASGGRSRLPGAAGHRRRQLPRPESVLRRPGDAPRPARSGRRQSCRVAASGCTAATTVAFTCRKRTPRSIRCWARATCSASANGSWRADNSISTTLPYHANFWSHGRLLVALQDNGAAYVNPDGSGVEICGGDSMEVLPGPTDDSLFCTHGGDTVD